MAHASTVMVVSSEGIPLVCDKSKPLPHYWKFPGGKGDGDETPEETAVRELDEEIGIRIQVTDLQRISEEQRCDHTHFFFRADITRLTSLKQHGDEGEQVKVFMPQEILRLDFFPPHLKLAEVELWELMK